MTDYDDVRTCCDAAKICPKCWPLMNCAVKVLDEGLREDFGFNTFCGCIPGDEGYTRGVSDERARNCRTTKEARWRNIFPCSKVSKAEAKKKKTNLSFAKGVMAKMHPRLERAYENVLKPFWKKEFCGAEIDGIEEASRHHFVHDSRRER